MFEIDGGGVSPTGGRAPVLPMPREELADSGQVVVHFKIASDDAALRLELGQEIAARLAPMRVHGHKIVPIITREGVEMEEADIRRLASFVTAQVKRDLGIP